MLVIDLEMGNNMMKYITKLVVEVFLQYFRKKVIEYKMYMMYLHLKYVFKIIVF